MQRKETTLENLPLTGVKTVHQGNREHQGGSLHGTYVALRCARSQRWPTFSLCPSSASTVAAGLSERSELEFLMDVSPL